MTAYEPDNPDTPFDGAYVTDKELLENWRTFMRVMPVVFLWLLIEAWPLGQGWAAAWLPHGVATWFCLGLITWWRHAIAALFVTVIAANDARAAFVNTWSKEWNSFST